MIHRFLMRKFECLYTAIHGVMQTGLPQHEMACFDKDKENNVLHRHRVGLSMSKGRWSGSASQPHLRCGLTLESRHSWGSHVTLRARDAWRATNPLDTQGKSQPGNAQEMVRLSSNLLVRGLGQALRTVRRSPVNKRGLVRS